LLLLLLLLGDDILVLSETVFSLPKFHFLFFPGDPLTQLLVGNLRVFGVTELALILGLDKLEAVESAEGLVDVDRLSRRKTSVVDDRVGVDERLDVVNTERLRRVVAVGQVSGLGLIGEARNRVRNLLVEIEFCHRSRIQVEGLRRRRCRRRRRRRRRRRPMFIAFAGRHHR